MRAARELWSPLGAALALTAAVLFFGGSSGNSTLPWVGGAAIVLAAAFVAAWGLPVGAATLLPLVGFAFWCAVSVAWSIEPDRTWDYANRTGVYVAFAIVGMFVAGRTRELALGFAALLGAVCVWALAGKVLEVSARIMIGVDAGLTLRKEGRVGRSAGRSVSAALIAACTSRAAPSSSRSPTRAEASRLRASSSRRGSSCRASGSRVSPPWSQRACRRR